MTEEINIERTRNCHNNQIHADDIFKKGYDEESMNIQNDTNAENDNDKPQDEIFNLQENHEINCGHQSRYQTDFSADVINNKERGRFVVEKVTDPQHVSIFLKFYYH